MHKLAVAPLYLAALVLAGCSSSGNGPAGSAPTEGSAPSSNGAATPAPAATAVTGTVALQDPSLSVSPQATLELALVDVTQQPNATINTQNFNPPQFPQAFHIPFSASAINAKDLYVLQATMQNDGRTYSTKLQQPVLTSGQPAKVDLTLVAEPTAADKVLAAFNDAKRQTGGMSSKTGTSSKIGESRSWQVFSNPQGVQFIIEQVNHGDTGGFTKTEYAYRDTQPWVVVQEQMASAGGKPTSTERVGWDNNGAVVLNQKLSGGSTGTLSSAETKALHAQSEAEFGRFTKQH